MGLFKAPAMPPMPAIPPAPPPPPAYGAIQGEKPGRKPMAASFLGSDMSSMMLAGRPEGFATLMGSMGGFGGQGPTSGAVSGAKTLIGQ